MEIPEPIRITPLVAPTVEPLQPEATPVAEGAVIEAAEPQPVAEAESEVTPVTEPTETETAPIAEGESAAHKLLFGESETPKGETTPTPTIDINSPTYAKLKDYGISEFTPESVLSVLEKGQKPAINPLEGNTFLSEIATLQAAGKTPEQIIEALSAPDWSKASDKSIIEATVEAGGYSPEEAEIELESEIENYNNLTKSGKQRLINSMREQLSKAPSLKAKLLEEGTKAMEAQNSLLERGFQQADHSLQTNFLGQKVLGVTITPEIAQKAKTIFKELVSGSVVSIGPDGKPAIDANGKLLFLIVKAEISNHAAEVARKNGEANGREQIAAKLSNPSINSKQPSPPPSKGETPFQKSLRESGIPDPIRIR